MVKAGNEIIQAFPITESTFIGVASAYTGSAKILHAAADGTITFNFANGSSISVDVIAGQDLAVDRDTDSITSTATVWIS